MCNGRPDAFLGIKGELDEDPAGYVDFIVD
jgi:hypothetical protein